jgi:RNA polymerase sigma-70 factor (ECF subfamily)
VTLAPGIGAVVGRAAAIAELRGAEQGLVALEPIPPRAVASYQPYWALRAHLLSNLGRATEARDAYEVAVGLSEDQAVREFLMERCRSAAQRLREAP